MLGEPENQFSLTRAVLSTGGREKQIPINQTTNVASEIGFGLFGHRLEYANGQARENDLPVAGNFLISSNRIIRLAHADVDHTSRLDVDDICWRSKRTSSDFV